MGDVTVAPGWKSKTCGFFLTTFSNAIAIRRHQIHREEFEQVLDDGISYSQEFDQHVAKYVPDLYSDLKQR